VPATSLREVAALKIITQKNIVRLLDVMCSGSALTLVFEYMERDLRSYIKQSWPIKPSDIQHLFYQLVVGIGYMHQQRFLHRDLKPHNVLLDKDLTTSSCLKIADFGFARMFGPVNTTFTREVVTLWYRSPEILLGSQAYASSVDIWSCGCILGELAIGRALFPGDSEIGTILKIFELCGTPNESTWPNFLQLPFVSHRYPSWRGNLKEVMQSRAPHFGQDGVALLGDFLACEPDSRPTARKAARHAFFKCVDPTKYDAAHLAPAVERGA